MPVAVTNAAKILHAVQYVEKELNLIK